MQTKRSGRNGFTMIEVLVVIAIIAVLMGLLVPAIGRTRDSARLSHSLSNLRNLSAAHASYAATFNDRQFTLINDNLASYGDSAAAAIANFASEGMLHPPIVLGYANGPGGIYARWSYFVSPQLPFNTSLVQPITFEGPNRGLGAFRLPNARQFNTFVGGRFYDRVFYAPKDTIVMDAITDPVNAGAGNASCFDDPGEFCIRPAVGLNDIPVWSSYVLSPAAMLNPNVMAADWQNPWSTGAGFRSPSMGHTRYASLKTHMIEHHWLQGRRTQCNPGFTGPTPYGRNCEPYYFNHGMDSAPAALFYDGSVRTVSLRQAQRADARQLQQNGAGLWHRSAGEFGVNGYFGDRAYDFTDSSFHVLTVDGIRGRDITHDGG